MTAPRGTRASVVGDGRGKKKPLLKEASYVVAIKSPWVSGGFATLIRVLMMSNRVVAPRVEREDGHEKVKSIEGCGLKSVRN